MTTDLTGCQTSRPFRVLVAEDNNLVLNAIECFMTNAGVSVQSSVDGQDALQRWLEDPSGYDALITDHQMPRMTGLELVREIRAHAVSGMDLKVIVHSGCLGAADISDYLAFQVECILQKPCLPQNLIDAVLVARKSSLWPRAK